MIIEEQKNSLGSQIMIKKILSSETSYVNIEFPSSQTNLRYFFSCLFINREEKEISQE